MLLMTIIRTSSSDEKATLRANSNSFIYDTVLPQLKRLRSRNLGQLSGVVFPPPRVNEFDERPSWQPRRAATERYVYCHNDLAQQNIVVDTKTLKVISLIDWEYSGFFPPDFEKPFWLDPAQNGRIDQEESARLVALLDEPGRFRCRR